MDGSDLKTSEKPSAPRFVIPSAAEGSFWQTHKRPTCYSRETKHKDVDFHFHTDMDNRKARKISRLRSK